MLDSILVALCTGIIGFAGMLMIMMPGSWMGIFIAIIMNMNFFFFAGTCRILIAYAKFKTWENIMFKMSIKVSLLGYLILAAYFMIEDMSSHLSLTDQEQDILKNFFFLYIFGLFTLYMEIFSKVSDFDGSANLQYHMTLDDESTLL